MVPNVRRAQGVKIMPMGTRVTWTGTLAGRLPILARASHAPLIVEDRDDTVLADLYDDHYGSLVRMATLLVQDVATAEDITQAAFVGISIRRGMRNPADRAAYLRHAVVTGARAARRRPAANWCEELADIPVLAMLGSLPSRQREALVLCYYANLSDAEAAAAMGVTRGVLRKHAERGLAAVGDLSKVG
jgi:DNA-directed RNA polymerase specialized sigma24 family protein